MCGGRLPGREGGSNAMTRHDGILKSFSRRRLLEAGTAAGVAAAAPALLSAPALVRAQSKVELNLVFHVWAGWEDALKAIIQGFEAKNPSISVKYQLVQFDQLPATLTPRFAAKAPPDLVGANGGFPWAAQGLLIDLQPLVSRDKVDLTKLAGTLSIGRVLGKPEQLGLPVYLTGGLVFFNKTLFDKYGVAHPKQGWTMDDLRAAAVALTRDSQGRAPSDQGFDAQNIGHYGIYHGGGQLDEPFIRNFGGHFFNQDYTAALLTDPKTQAGFAYLNELACAEHALIIPQPGAAAPVDPFVSQQVAISVNGEWQFSLYDSISDFDWDVAPPPQGPSGYPDDYHVYAASDTIGIAKDSKHQDEAWEFIKYLCFDPSAQLNVAGSLGPALKEVAASPDFLAKRKGARGPSQENVVWSYKEMGAHSSFEYYLGTTKNATKWTPVYSDFEQSLLTLCNVDLKSLLADYNGKLTDAINSAS
jgi:multiple sugar transport system substrate-binding protein